MVDFPKFTIKQMLECGVHFGHKSRVWNPKMAPYIYTVRNGLHIINLQKTFSLLFKALKVVDALVQSKPNVQILFVGTKHQAAEHIKEAASRCGQFYIDHRWLGGMLTNWHTISKSIATFEDLEKKLKGIEGGEDTEDTEDTKYSKKEILEFTRKKDKLEKVLGGIRNLKGKPDLLFIIDIKREHIAIKEAKALGIPVVAIVDTNCNPEGVDYIIPGNDDSTKAIQLYCNLVSDTILHALEKSLERSGISFDTIKEVKEVEGVEKEMQEQESQEPKESEPKKPEPKESEPKKPEPKESEPKKPEPKESEPKKPEPKKPEPKKPEPKKPEPKEPEPKKPEPKEPEPKKPEPKKPEPKKPEPKKPEPKESEPKKPEPKKAKETKK